MRQALGTGRTAAARGWHSSLAMLLTPPAPRTLPCTGSEIFLFTSAGGRSWCANKLFLLEFTGEKSFVHSSKDFEGQHSQL